MAGPIEALAALPSDVRYSLAGVGSQAALLTKVPSGVRRPALATIMKEMSLDPQDEGLVIDILGYLLFDYHRLAVSLGSQLTPQQRRRWYERVGKTTNALLAILNEPPAKNNRLTDSVGISAAILRSLDRAQHIAEQLKHSETPFDKATTKPRDWAANRLICNVAYWYKQQTGKSANLSRGNDHYKRSTRHGKPGGPFFRVMASVFALAGEPREGEALAGAIRRSTCSD